MMVFTWQKSKDWPKAVCTWALFVWLLLACCLPTQAQRLSAAEGIAVVGYVDKGAYLNFTGPNLHWDFRNSKLLVGMLPSLRFKQDHGTPKNSFVSPSLGIGISYCYKKAVLQLPFYYTAKTSTTDGRWFLGAGLGWRIDRKP